MVKIGLGKVEKVSVGREYGRGDKKEIDYEGWREYEIGVGLMELMGIMMVIMKRVLIGILMKIKDKKNMKVMEIEVKLIEIEEMLKIVEGEKDVEEGMLRGLRDKRIKMLIEILGYWGVGLKIGEVMELKLGMGGVGIWIGIEEGIGMVEVMMKIRWRRNMENV